MNAVPHLGGTKILFPFLAVAYLLFASCPEASRGNGDQPDSSGSLEQGGAPTDSGVQDSSPAESGIESETPSPRHVVLVIGDGMGRSAEIAASRFLYGRDDGLAWEDFPFKAWVTTWDVTTYNAHAADLAREPWSVGAIDPRLGYDPAKGGGSPWPEAGAPDGPATRAWLLYAATDSAAAATAMSCGSKTDAGRIAWSSASSTDAPLETVSEAARSRLGMAIGVVTTVPFDHATPAAFVAHSGARSDYAAIAASIIGVTRPEVVIGGGHPGWSSGFLGKDALATLGSDQAWILAERVSGKSGAESLNEASLARSAGQGLFGLFGGADGAFEAPRPTGSADASGSPRFVRNEENPSLACSALTALELLSADAEGFVLVVEQGDIDWANHANDLRRMFGSMASLDETVLAIETFVDRQGDGITWDNTLLVVTADHSTGFLRYPSSTVIGRGVLPLESSGPVYSYPEGAVTYGSTGHANELVTLRARGAGADAAFSGLAGADYPGVSVMENTAIHEALMRFLAGR